VSGARLIRDPGADASRAGLKLRNFQVMEISLPPNQVVQKLTVKNYL